MRESTTVAVGLDVHARSIRLAAVRADELLEERTLPYDEEQVERLLRRWPGVRCCYEAGPTGFGLYRHLLERGIECVVVAPGLVPQRPGDRVKTDPRDARKLARLHAGGLLEPIYVPSPELEAARDLVRAREDARLDRMRDRQRLSKFCLRHGRLLPTSAWTVIRRKWLGEQRFEHAAEQITFDTYLHAVDLVDRRIEMLERAIRESAEQGPWSELVARLRCLATSSLHGPCSALSRIARSSISIRRSTRSTACRYVSNVICSAACSNRCSPSHLRRMTVQALVGSSRPWRRQNFDRRCRSRIRSSRASSRARTRSPPPPAPARAHESIRATRRRAGARACVHRADRS